MADAALKVASDVLLKVTDYAIKRTAHEFGYLIHYRSNIDLLEQKIEDLNAVSEDRKSKVDEERRNGRLTSREVERWLERVEKERDEGKRFLQTTTGESNRCLNGWCPNIKKCYKQGKEAKKRATKVSDLEKQVIKELSVSPPPLPVGARSSVTFKDFQSRKPTIEKLMERLSSGGSEKIGICGMGGSGKTTMVKEIATKVRGGEFDEIVFGTVSQEPDLIKIQDEIAAYLGLNFEDTSSVDARADKLHQRLEQSKKGNLVILDDLWKCLDLEKIGIRFGLENKKCKVVLTSRSRDVCKAMKCEDVLEINALSREEAWTMFKDIIGDSIDDPDLCQTALQVVEKCGGLPVAIVILGNSLKDEMKEVWNTTLLKLQNFRVPTNITDMNEVVYQSLKVSYDLLGDDEEAKKLFLLCCLFPEDENIELEDLVRYGMGLKLFKDVEYLPEGRSMVVTLIHKLKNRFLLIDGRNKLTVKVHDKVRAVGLSIATTKEPNDVEFGGMV